MNISLALCNGLLIEEWELTNFVRTAPRRYKTYYIAKRGSNQTRLIAQPAKPVKFIQSLAVDILRSHLKVHSCAMAYEKGCSIKKNALAHCKSRYLLKMDFKNFFLSITPDIFFQALNRAGVQINEKDQYILENLLFWKLRRNSSLRLSIGAPSSPFISNIVMYDFDELVSIKCKELNITYTRYADDMTFTTNKRDVLFELPSAIRKLTNEMFGGKIKINTEKTVYSSKASNRHVTGITLTNDEKISIGRNNKRIISAMMHRFSLDMLNEKQIETLQGKLSYANHIEPDFISRMQKKYGEPIISSLFKKI